MWKKSLDVKEYKWVAFFVKNQFEIKNLDAVVYIAHISNK